MTLGGGLWGGVMVCVCEFVGWSGGEVGCGICSV